MKTWEKNVLIHRFMLKDKEGELADFEHCLENKAGTAESLHYHEYWDWLMPVVEKISEEGYEFNILSEHFSIGKYMVAGMIDWLVEVTQEDNEKLLENVYKGIVKFLEEHYYAT